MNDPSLNRRRFLAAASTGLLGSVAGCVGDVIPFRTSSADEPSNATGGDGGTRNDRPRADGTAYTDVYEETIDSVTFLRVFGLESPFTETGGQGQGSGFLYDDSHVVTNEHVVYGGDDVDVRYTNGDWATTEVVGTDYYSDLAVLEVDHVPEGTQPLTLSGDRPAVGQRVLAIGNPFGLEGSMSQGIVSGVNRSVQMPDRQFSFPNVVQTDTPINPGNSGGPLVDLDGEVLGVVNAGGGDNIGFAISAAMTDRVVPALVEDGEYDHSYMGIRLDTVDRVIATENDLPEVDGVIVSGVESGGPADGVLQESNEDVRRHGDRIPVGGDVIVELDGEPIPDRHALSTYLALETTPGDTITVGVYRDDEETTVELTLASRPAVD